MIREINVKELTENISEMCIQANHYLSPDMDTFSLPSHLSPRVSFL